MAGLGQTLHPSSAMGEIRLCRKDVKQIHTQSGGHNEGSTGLIGGELNRDRGSRPMHRLTKQVPVLPFRALP